ncbi:MAG: glycoside hydrolase [Planctomycetes bacterium]|nr:glycoside hydrolase [Planctomycetota bacterium]
MNRWTRSLAGIVTTFLTIYCGVVAAGEVDFLTEGFRRPPQSAGVRCFWWWLNGNVTKDAITRDLEQMQAKGFSGALIVDAGGAEQRGNSQVPAGPVFASPAWRELFVHAVREAHRLGLELSLNIQSGWNLGGPPVTPQLAAKMLTWSQVVIEGPIAYNAKLPQPATRDGFYRDIAVLAYPEKNDSKGGSAKAQGPGEGSRKKPIRDLAIKAASKEIGMSAPDCRFLLTDIPATPGEEDVRVADVQDLSGRMKLDGELTWEVPAGKWVVLRFGCTPSAARVSTASNEWQGRVIDYLDAEVLRQYWEGTLAPMLADIGPLAGDSLKYLHTDSWECGGANWTPNLPAEFRQRRGYSLIPYLPVIAGKIVASRDLSNRFLADFRKTIGDCIADNHYARFAEMAHRYGMGIHPESGGPHAGPFDGLKCLARNDMVLSEFWVPSPHRPKPEQRFFVKQAASVAHVYGTKLVGAEAFTSIGPHWNDVLWSAHKPSFDHEACSGLTLCFLHTFTCSPREMGLPGQEYFAGTHTNPNVTWWGLSDAFFAYLGRCQHLLRQGRFVADVCHYVGDHVPNIFPLKETDPARVLPGYDYDVISEEALLTKLGVEEGRLTVPGGVRYRLLSLPDHKILSLPALQAVAKLVEAGATVLGPKPERTVSLVDYPRCERQFARLANRLWGDATAETGRRMVGQGRVIWGQTARAVLAEDDVPPDFEYAAPGDPVVLDYLHRQLDGGDLYFICNQSDREMEVECRFRVVGRKPELWNPVTGTIADADNFRQANGRTHVRVPFGPYGSWFVVFRTPIDAGASSQGQRHEWVELHRLEGPWNVTFVSPWGDTFATTLETLLDWTRHQDERIRYHSGTAVYEHAFEMPADLPAAPAGIMLDLGAVGDVGIARISLNGKDLGIVWTRPLRVEVAAAIKAGPNHLKVEVANSWRNRLLGDRPLPPDQRRTRTNITIRDDWQLSPSGLLGPVRLLK